MRYPKQKNKRYQQIKPRYLQQEKTVTYIYDGDGEVVFKCLDNETTLTSSTKQNDGDLFVR